MAQAKSEQVVYLHGDLDLHVIEARHLPNMHIVSELFRHFFTACGTINLSSRSHSEPAPSDVGAEDRKIRQPRKIFTSDCYVSVIVPQATVAQTRFIKNSQNPKWDEKFVIPLAHPVVDLQFQVKIKDIYGSELIGTAKISAANIASGEVISGWFTIIGPTGKVPKPDCAINVELKFTLVESNPVYKHGIAGDPEHKGVMPPTSH
ncbi:hypothetical protein M0R45_003903 [Rubus argutus]|uniref:C2 domain-containing protein n=1 Tax=Rubus argutus TaxID=59490 RepID=A0AAW1YHN1_RUBAR